MPVDVTIRIAGQAGQGMQSISSILGKIFTRHGYYVFITQDVESRIRGGHNYSQLRIRDIPVQAVSEKIQLLIALDEGEIEKDIGDLVKDGTLIYDGTRSLFRSENPNHISVPMEKLALEAGGDKIMENSVATGAALATMGFGLEPLLDRLEVEFRGKGKEIIEKNRRSASAGYRYIVEKFRGVCPCQVPPAPATAKSKMMITGSEAIAAGAICSGLKFYAGYPMSPSTPIMEFIASMAERFGIIVEPAEDEIAAINMAIGASFAGVRSMTATSGGGFCLMVEGLGLAGMTETPVVVVVAQRPGPSTGLPTRTEQADLRFVMHAAHGEFPRVVLAPGNAEQAFYLTAKAFNLAERYQTPVLILGDQHLNDSSFTLDELDPGRVEIDRGKILPEDATIAATGYRRYALDRSGVSPRILPGHPSEVLYADSDEHTEEGHITESAEVRRRMVEKRMKKLERIRQEIDKPIINPESRGDIILLGWGSTLGAIEEAASILNTEGFRVQMVHFSEIYPFPIWNSLELRENSPKIFAVENNYTGQFADFFSFETGLPVFRKILKYDGRPFTPQEIVRRVKDGIQRI